MSQESKMKGAVPAPSSDRPPTQQQIGIKDSIAVVVTPKDSRNGSIRGELETLGNDRYEMSLGVHPRRLIITPEGSSPIDVQKDALPINFSIDGCKMSIELFTDNGFIIKDGGCSGKRIGIVVVETQPKTASIGAPTSPRIRLTARIIDPERPEPTVERARLYVSNALAVS